MVKKINLTAARLNTVLQRQDPPGWGSKYVPGILATREEAPSRSRPSQIWSHRLNRALHALSVPEREIMMVALYHPNVCEIQEQRMLACTPSGHPLSYHPRGRSKDWIAMRGTLKVAESLGVLKLIPVFYPEPAEPGGESEPVPYPFFGDILVFVEGSGGPFCVNWTVKLRPEDFERPFGANERSQSGPGKSENEIARHKIEAVLYQEVGIPTIRLTELDYSKDVVANLTQLLYWAGRAHPFTEFLRAEIVNRFKAGMSAGTPAIADVLLLCIEHQASSHDIKVVLHQAIWNRELRIDLFQPFLIDMPLIPETRDVLDVYGHWFKAV